MGMWRDSVDGGNLERLMTTIYSLFEDKSSKFIDEYDIWYQLSVVVETLHVENSEEINGLYLMDVNGEQYISQEGINFVLIHFDTSFKDDINFYMTNDIMPDLKDYNLYMPAYLKDILVNCDVDFSVNENRSLYDEEQIKPIMDHSKRIIEKYITETSNNIGEKQPRKKYYRSHK